jgi:hypothetical protein
MTLTQLVHVLRAASNISGEKSFVVVGSQAVLLLNESLDRRLTMSDEIDLYPAMAPDKADEIDAAIGALSSFHDEFGYHADGVGPETAVMPPDWMGRAQFHYFGELTVIAPEIHDLCISKGVAGREKDADFVRLLLRDGLAKLSLIEQRIDAMDPQTFSTETLRGWMRRRQREAEDPSIP